MAIEPIRRRHGDEKLRAVGARPGVGHGEAAGAVEGKVIHEFVVKLVTGPARAGAERAASLNHEFRYHAVEDLAVVKRPLGPLVRLGIHKFLRSLREPHEVLDGHRRLVREKLAGNFPKSGVKYSIVARLQIAHEFSCSGDDTGMAPTSQFPATEGAILPFTIVLQGRTFILKVPPVGSS